MSTLHRVVAAAATRLAVRRAAAPRSAPTRFATNVNVNVLPTPGALSTLRSPPMSRAWARLMARPRPVPPARAPAFELLERLEHPREVLLRDADPRVRDDDLDEVASSATALDDAVTRIDPCLVNLTALLTRLMRTCFTLPPSPRSERGSSGAARSSARCPWRQLDGEHLLHLVERRAEVERILDELGAAGLDLGHLEHVVEERREVLAALLDGLDPLPLRPRRARGRAGELCACNMITSRGVRISWDMWARNWLLAWLARSASSLASRSSRVRVATSSSSLSRWARSSVTSCI